MKEYDVVIIGGGVTGTALAYSLTKYSSVKKVALLEKYGEVACVQSSKNNNSQTLHFGDIETNYSLEKARKVKAGAELVAAYVEKHKGEKLFNKTHKMVLAVGEKEVSRLKKRYEEFKLLFPKQKALTLEELKDIEPKVVEGRDENIPLLALLSEDGYAINYGKLAKSFVSESEKTGKFYLFLEHVVEDIKKVSEGYEIKSKGEVFRSKVVLVCASGYSLNLAYSLDHGKDLILLPVAGSFFCSPKQLNGKVYMMQLPKLPFAAVHGDPDVENPNETRFGPTAKVLPMLERWKYNSVKDFFRLFDFRWDAIMSLLTIIKDPVYLKFVFRNVLYDLPWFGRWFFLKEVRKVVPSMTFSKLHYGKKVGGIRPQVVNVKKRSMALGEAKIYGEDIIFNITPSPGASTCLQNALDDSLKVMDFFKEKYSFDEKKFLKEHQR